MYKTKTNLKLVLKIPEKFVSAGNFSTTQSFWLWEKGWWITSGFPICNIKMVTFTPDRNRWPWKYSSIPYKGAIDLFLKWCLTKWSGSQILLLQKLLRLTNPPCSTQSQIGSKEIICSKLGLVVPHQKKLELILLKLTAMSTDELINNFNNLQMGNFNFSNGICWNKIEPQIHLLLLA